MTAEPRGHGPEGKQRIQRPKARADVLVSEMTQCMRVLVTTPVDLSSIPGAYVVEREN